MFKALFWQTAILVAVVYTVLGLFMFIASRNIKLIFLPFLYAIFGCITGIVNSAILCMNQLDIINCSGNSPVCLCGFSLSCNREENLLFVDYTGIYHLLQQVFKK